MVIGWYTQHLSQIPQLIRILHKKKSRAVMLSTYFPTKQLTLHPSHAFTSVVCFTFRKSEKRAITNTSEKSWEKRIEYKIFIYLPLIRISNLLFFNTFIFPNDILQLSIMMLKLRISEWHYSKKPSNFIMISSNSASTAVLYISVAFLHLYPCCL